MARHYSKLFTWTVRFNSPSSSLRSVLYLHFIDTETEAQKCYMLNTWILSSRKGREHISEANWERCRKTERKSINAFYRLQTGTWQRSTAHMSSRQSWFSGDLWSTFGEPRDNTVEGLWGEQAKWGPIRQGRRLGRRGMDFWRHIREDIRSRARGMVPKSRAWLPGEEGSLEHTEGTDLTCRGDLFCILLKIW